MDPIRKILVIVDPTSETQPAVGKAARLATQFKADLELFACDTKASRMKREAAHARRHSAQPFVADLRPLLEALAAPLRAQGIVVTTATTPIVDSLYAELVQRTRNAMADLVVKDTHHHSIARRTFFSNTDWQLIRSCPVPLLLVKSHTWPKHPCIIVAVDPGHVNDKPATLDKRILDCATLVNKQLSGEMHVVHAYLPEAVIAQSLAGEPPLVGALTTESLAIEEQRKRAQVVALLEGIAIPDKNVHVQVASPMELVTQFSESLHADITVMGAVSRSGLGRAFIGSTAEDILERLPCDALIVKTPDFGEALPF